MEIFKKIWHWLFDKKEVESYEDIKAKCLKDAPVTYNTGGYIKNAERYVAPRYYSSCDSGCYSSSSDSGSSSSSCDSGC